MQEVIDIREASEFLTISEWKLRQEVKKRTIPHFRVGKRILFRRSALISWIEDQEQKCQSN